MLTTALEAARRDIGRDLAVAEPDRVTAAQAADVVSLFAEVERLVGAGKVLFSDRAAAVHEMARRGTPVRGVVDGGEDRHRDG